MVVVLAMQMTMMTMMMMMMMMVVVVMVVMVARGVVGVMLFPYSVRMLGTNIRATVDTGSVIERMCKGDAATTSWTCSDVALQRPPWCFENISLHDTPTETIARNVLAQVEARRHFYLENAQPYDSAWTIKRME
ncbi:uncharacterized protein LOC105283969 [Ooceraea biroi]|uniref:uncharacterized protein LOC105283969 n=1 Tax=Ooceraea biroi TaxID=2015173 RepID=UPI000F07B7F9|nr:uncharacterized protein LOC105283969 [Ooceraea biroi]